MGSRDGPVYRNFQNALSVVTTVVSKPTHDMAVVDGGYKAFSTDRRFMPQLYGIEGIEYSWGGDEHGRLHLERASSPINLGDRLEIIIPHCDPTVNPYDRILYRRGDALEDVWSIAARGKLLFQIFESEGRGREAQDGLRQFREPKPKPSTAEDSRRRPVVRQ